MRRVLRTWAQDAAAVAQVIAGQDPSWRSESFELAGGHVALWGAGLYVNRALAVGLDAPLSATDFEHVESRSSAIGVDASLEVTPETQPGVRGLAESRGYAARTGIVVLRRDLDDADRLTSDRSIVIEPAAGNLSVWQEVSALGWARRSGSARRASDAFAAATALIDGDGFVLARDAADGTPLGCASLAVRENIATLQAMSTVPDARRRGVQAELIRHRLRHAGAAGCAVAVTATEAGGISERNLRRHGFSPWFEITIMTRSGDPATR